MIRNFILYFLVFLFLFLFSRSSPVFAEVVTFRDEGGTCYPMSLNETASVKVNGAAGPGCGITVDVVGGGEWVSTGEYFDTPPYAWGADTYYADKQISKSVFSFFIVLLNTLLLPVVRATASRYPKVAN